jgi:hypothetical protein
MAVGVGGQERRMLCLLVLPSAYNAAGAFASHNQRIARLSHLYLNCIDRCGKASAQERQNKHGHTHTYAHTHTHAAAHNKSKQQQQQQQQQPCLSCLLNERGLCMAATGRGKYAFDMRESGQKNPINHHTSHAFHTQIPAPKHNKHQ